MAEINFKLKYLLHKIELLLKSLTAAKHFYVFRQFKLGVFTLMGFFLLATMLAINSHAREHFKFSQQCLKIYNSESSKTNPPTRKFFNTSNSSKHRNQWIQRHIEGLELITPEQLKVFSYFLEFFWNLLRQVDSDFRIIVIPTNSKITDHPKFKKWQGVQLSQKHTQSLNLLFNSEISTKYTWDHVDGATLYPFCAIKYDQLKTSTNDYQPVVHELGHVIEQALLTTLEKQTLKVLYSLANDQPSHFLSIYSMTNANEYFAESILAYARTKSFLEPTYDENSSLLTREDLQKNDPEMFRFIRDLLRSRAGTN